MKTNFPPGAQLKSDLCLWPTFTCMYNVQSTIYIKVKSSSQKQKYKNAKLNNTIAKIKRKHKQFQKEKNENTEKFKDIKYNNAKYKK